VDARVPSSPQETPASGGDQLQLEAPEGIAAAEVVAWPSEAQAPEAGAGAGPADSSIRSPRRTAPVRSALLASFLSFIFPGLGQLYMGRRIAALVFGVPSAATVVWAAMQLDNGLVYFAAALLDDSYALTIMALAAAFTLWRVVAIADPFVAARHARVGVRAVSVLAALIVLALGMGDVAFSNAANWYDFDHQIAANDFSDPTMSPQSSLPTADATLTGPFTASPTATYADTLQPSESPSDSPTPEPSDPCSGTYKAFTGGLEFDLKPVAHAPGAAQADATAGPTAEATATVGPTASSSPEPTPTTEATTSPSPSPPPSPSPSTSPSSSPSESPSDGPTEGPAHRLTVLLTGVDFMSGRHHALNDTLMLVSIDLQTGAVAMVSVPRDSAGFPFYWGGYAPDNFKINGLAMAISAGRFGSPDSPMITLANEIGYLVGLTVDYYAEIDMDGFSQLVDLVGGVDINNPRVLDDPSTCTYVPAGRVHLNGMMALRYVRSRETSNDYYRAGRQQIVMVALEKKLASPAMLPKLGSLLALGGKSIATNFPLKTAKDYVAVAQGITSISGCVLGPPYNYHPDSSLTGGTWTSHLLLDQVANLSVYLFGPDSLYYGQPGVAPQACRNHY
jgi:LCP family protein required for cell wall assembly